MKSIILNTAVIIITVLIILFPQNAILYSKDALNCAYEIIIPSLFPFFVCSGIMIYSGFAEFTARLFKPIMKPLFNVNENGAVAFVLGLLSGYPLGAITTCQLYESAYISKSEAERLLAFCNNSGPLFILGSISSAIFVNKRIGVIIYLSHILSAITVGLIFRFYGKNTFSAPKSQIGIKNQSISEIFATVLANSINSILTICGAIIFFFTVTNCILLLLPKNNIINAIITAILEITGGIKKISLLDISLSRKIILSSMALGFSGICVHLQVMAVTAKHLLSLKPYIFGKIMQSLLSACYTYVILKLFPISTSAINDLSKSSASVKPIKYWYIFIIVFVIMYIIKKCLFATKKAG